MVQRLGPLQMERKLLEKPRGVHTRSVMLQGCDWQQAIASVVHGAKPCYDMS